ncbi:MAG: hypothetical protein Q7T25_13405, partial [Sideroxyarcus sp.]|nr:hypothetical protein [Sideroxyarcus sp.]
LLERVADLDSIFFVAHSLGGIHALHLANELPGKVRGGVTLSTPYGGSESAEMLRYLLPFQRVLHDIAPRAAPIVEANGFEILVPWTNIVTMRGDSPLMRTANDGVVTRNSMRNRKDIHLIDVESNHFEILQHPEAVRIICESAQEAADKKFEDKDAAQVTGQADSAPQ